MAKIPNKTTKTKKIRRIIDKKIWDTFDSELGKTSKIECLYNDSNERETCELCASQLSYNENSFLTCTNDKCGVVYRETLDHTPEWRYYGSNDCGGIDPTRCGMPINPLLKESSYGCSVSYNPRAPHEMKKIRRYTEWQSMPYKEKSQYDEFERIKTMANIHGIPKIIVDDALRYHKLIYQERTFRGLNRDGILAASIYISCRINNLPRTAKELAIIFHLDCSSATRGCKNAMSILNKLEKDKTGLEKTQLCKTRPIDFIDRYCTRLNMNKELTKLCQFIAIKIETSNYIPENTPHSIAAGIVYFVSELCGINIIKRDVNKVSEISEVTINKCYKKLFDIREQLIPPSILKKYKCV